VIAVKEKCMNGKMITAAFVGLVLGYAGALHWGQPASLAREKGGKQRWEYRVVFSTTEGAGNEKKMTEQYNALAAEGWEYVGPVVDSTHAKSPNGNYAGIGGAYVVFKRAK
jgi:hypothetical protein